MIQPNDSMFQLKSIALVIEPLQLNLEASYDNNIIDF